MNDILDCSLTSVWSFLSFPTTAGMCRFGWALKSIYRKGWKGRARARVSSVLTTRRSLMAKARVANLRPNRPSPKKKERVKEKRRFSVGRSVTLYSKITITVGGGAALFCIPHRGREPSRPGERAQRVSLWLVTWICRPQLRRS